MRKFVEAFLVSLIIFQLYVGNCRAYLNHLSWDCSAYNPPRLRALATINRGPWPFFSSDKSLPGAFAPDRAIKLWRALILFLQDPTAPLVGDLLLDSYKIQAIQMAPTYCLYDNIGANGKEHEVAVYAATEGNYVKGGIRNVERDIGYTEVAKILIHQGNPTVRGANLIKDTGSVVILFDGGHVPSYIEVVRWYLYKKIEVCSKCSRVSNYVDV
ncbi:hypothetical protein MRX96_032119 [Rhipicephalus microplus]